MAAKESLEPASVIRALFTQDVLTVIRRELNRGAPARLDLEDIFNAIREVLSKEALMQAGDISVRKTRKRRRLTKTRSDGVNGATASEGVEEEEDDESEEEDSSSSEEVS